MNKRDRKVQYEYVLNCINEDAYNKSYTEPKDKVEFLLRTFNEEYNHSYNKNKFPKLIDRIESYYRCLPSVFNIEFRDYNIIQIGKQWGYCQTKRSESEFCNQWWHRIANITLQLADKLEIDYEQNYQLV